jgi:hypothetical protein
MDDPFDCAPLLESDAALKPFLQAGQESSSASFSTLAALVAKVLSHADIFAGYDQLKAVLLEPIQRTAPNGDKGEEILRTLDLFSHGTYADYVAGGGTKFMTLSDSQVFKLRQLTVLSLVQAACLQKLDYLDYSTVEQAIVLESSSVAASSVEKLRAVETILISCMYSGAVSGRLCQKTQSLRFTTGRFASRDVPVAAAPDLLATVRQLQSRLQQAQQYLGVADVQVQESLAQDEQYWARVRQQADDQQQNRMLRSSSADAWSNAFVGHAGLLTAEVTSAAAAMDVTGRRQKRTRGGLNSNTTIGGGASAFHL